MANTTDLQSYVEEERVFASSQSNRTDALKIGKNCGALVRFLPVELGPDRTWFLRVGRHWINRLPYNCKRTSAPVIGGDPNYNCPLCEMCDKYTGDNDEEVSKNAKSSNGRPFWLLYCIVWQREEQDGRAFDVSRTEMHKPYAFWFQRDQWLELLKLYNRAQKGGKVPLSFLDPIYGHDIWLRKDSRGIMHFDREDTQSLVPNDPDASNKLVDSIIAKIKFEEYKMLEGEKLDTALDKLEDLLVGRRHTRSVESDDTDEPRTSRSTRSSRSSRSVEPESEPESPRSSRSSRTEPEAEPAPATTRTSRRSEPVQVQEAEPLPATPPARRGAIVRPQAEPTARRVEPAATRPSARPIDPMDDPDAPDGEPLDETPEESQETDNPPPAVRASPPPSVRRSSAPAVHASVEEDPEELPDEEHDAAPPITTAADNAVRTRPRLSRLVAEGVRAAQSAGEGEPEVPARRSTGGAS